MAYSEKKKEGDFMKTLNMEINRLRKSNADMLEALKLLANKAAHDYNCGFHAGIKCDCTRADLVQVVRAAIAKATA
jgi:hypothetical protein